jgi:hypothetical protein
MKVRCEAVQTRLELQIDEHVATSTSTSVRDRRQGLGIEEQLGKFIVGLHCLFSIFIRDL